MPWGGLVVTRVQGVGAAASGLEVRLSVALPVGEAEARATAEALAGELDQAVQAARVVGLVAVLH
jgi:hypothetical protein